MIAVCRAALVTLLLTVAGAAQDEAEASADVRAFLDRCTEAWSDVRTLRVHFTQTKELTILRRPRKSRGRVHVKDGRVLMVVANERGEVEMRLAVDAGEARLHYPKLARLEIYALDDGRSAPTPFPLFGHDLRALERDHRITIQALPDEVTELRLVPRAEGSAVRTLTMRFREHRVRSLEQVNVNGDKVVLTIERYEPGVEIADEELELDVPPDTEVVRVADPRGRSADD